jgi:hypothetical protein
MYYAKLLKDPTARNLKEKKKERQCNRDEEATEGSKQDVI